MKVLSSEELKGLSSYVRSPYFTKSKEALRLFDYIRKYHPEFSTSQLDKEKVFKKVFPTQSYSDIKLRNLRTKLFKIVENYLIHLHLEQENFQKKKILTEIYGKRNLYPEFERNTNLLLNLLAQNATQNVSDYFHKFSLNLDYYFHSTTNRHTAHKYIEDSLINLNHFYTFQRLIIGIDFKLRGNILAKNNSFHLYNYERIAPTNHQLYQLLLATYHLQEQDDESLFEEISITLTKLIDHIPSKYAVVVVQSLLNFCTQHLPVNRHKYSNRYYELFQIGLKNQLLFENQKLSYMSYMGFSQVATKLGKFEIAESFINKYATYLDPSISENAKVIATCYLYFFQKKYSAVLDLLPSYHPKHPYGNIQVKTLLIRIYFELYLQDKTYQDLLLSTCKSFEKYLKREVKMKQSKLLPFLNFLSFLHSLIRQLGKNNPTLPIYSLQEKLDAYPVIFAKDWLQEKLDEGAGNK